ncbi:TetR/AcrR family transcriptional regulator C-terminal ligand-binding domain-containing protein [Streptomyces sp. NBC_00829]|uniref:TetR/AcrR family transcriptional regulator C-terminal ligand-binding domain-containing protein n=1 Tax=Streptomyces sp. NBC_00829 TaxID=2903679 RepID=UPI00386B13DB|nr:TetR/AcrR family transcriptional regulator [Streptomyces sp. NBC_00829]
MRAAVRRAAGDALVEHGFHRLDLADVARRAEVGNTTVYRRWGHHHGTGRRPAGGHVADRSVSRTDTGSLAEDLRANARLVVRTLTDPRQGPSSRRSSPPPPATNAPPRPCRFYAKRITERAPCVDAAVDRGELPAGTDAQEVIRAVSAPLYCRLLAGGAPLDAADRAAGAAAAAARSGAYVSTG